MFEKEGYAKQVSKKVKKGFPVLEVELVYIDKNPKLPK